MKFVFVLSITLLIFLQNITVGDRQYKALMFGNSLADYIFHQPDMGPLQYAFSVCSWVRSLKTYGTPIWLSYAVRDSATDEILISDNGGYDVIFNSYGINPQSYYSGLSGRGIWFHYCMTWSYSSRMRRVYLNGREIGTISTADSERSLRTGGYIYLGNDQDDYPGGGFTESKPFAGQLYKTNLFSKELSGSEVLKMSQHKCSLVERSYGDMRVIKWENILSWKPTAFDISTISYAVLRGTPGEFLCSVTGIYKYSPETEISIVWFDKNGITYDTTSSVPDYIVTEKTLPMGGKSSILSVSGEVTKDNDLIVLACNATVGTESFDTNVYLSTFSVNTENVEVKFGEAATLTCSVDNGHVGAVKIRWFEDQDFEIQGTQKEVTQVDNFVTTISELVLKEAKKDTLYICQVSGTDTKTSSFDVELVVNDILLSPQGQIRAFVGTLVNMVCSCQSDLFWDGSFSWQLNGHICSSDSCKNKKDTAISSSLSIAAITEGTAGNWTCSFTKFSLGRSRKIESSPLQLTVIELTGTQTPTAMWGREGDEKEVICRVPVGLNYSHISDIEWTLNGYLIREGVTEPTQTWFTLGDKTQSDTELSGQ
ncbi:hypothetical protein ACHWQZ_G014853 [Mnemiopsis leidyi]